MSGFRLIDARTEAPPNLQSFLERLGTGDAGFGGTPVGDGSMTLDEYLDQHAQRDLIARPGWVPQTIWWMAASDEAAERVVGMVRMRHDLNDTLSVRGGHIGYYVDPAERRKGFASRALALVLTEIRKVGVHRAMLTTNPWNHGSIRVIEANGGVLDAQVPDPEEPGETINQYWIDLSKSP